MLREGHNDVVRARKVVVPLSPVPREDIVSGSPRQGSVELGTIGDCTAGIWELQDGVVTDTEIDEVFVVISGGATIELLDEGRSVEVKAGDVMRLAAGTRTRWIVEDHIRKIYLAAG
ncbi:cupin domain-containing protein [Microbacterium sp. NPDC058342]|uniref:cupin domain-containing protein n=1 Tax=Microbacterium sp. NPDC058342 TaxID=3346454 RepID=UPI00364B63C6